ncbi:hypothetical protein BOX15_Mlig025015g1 [Macrostomum lignano]|uniref:Uncharacterized protein n=1 Tax=Macrostomum lignano TaxID=282301 RepID=A0A267E2N2_9PLAT|nr:hypothetical protein BOX15_Mlig025015g1 [Macrostomum lignano]
MLDARMLHSIKVFKAEASMKGSSEKKKRNPLTKLAVDSIDAAATDLSASNSGEQLIYNLQV